MTRRHKQRLGPAKIPFSLNEEFVAAKTVAGDTHTVAMEKAIGLYVDKVRADVTSADAKGLWEHEQDGTQRSAMAKLAARLVAPSVDDDCITVAYASVVDQSQEPDLRQQEQALKLYCASNGWSVEFIADIGDDAAGYRKKGLKRLLDGVMDGSICRVVITHKERMLRIGADLIFALCEAKQVEVIVINQDPASSPSESQAKDVMGIISAVSARRYGSASDNGSGGETS